jgi:hypothetical protein
MNERDIELVNKVAEMTPDVYNTEYDNGMIGIEFTEDALQKFADLIRADEREAILGLADSLGWVDVDAIRARGNNV